MSFNIDFRKLKLKNNRTVEQQLIKEAERFKTILQKHIDDWYMSYSPKEYPRTSNMKNAVYVDDIVYIDTSSGNLSISVKYSDAVFHDSYFNEDKQVNTLYLMDSGYKVKKDVWFSDIPYFGHREAGNFLEKAVEEFNKANYWGIRANIKKPDSIYK